MIRRETLMMTCRALTIILKSSLLLGFFAHSTWGLSDELAQQKIAGQVFKLSPSITSFYARSAADISSASYSENAGINFDFTAVSDHAGSLRLSTGFARDLDSLEMKNNWSATAISYSSQKFIVAECYGFTYGLTGVLPTNSDSRNFLSYRGSLGADVNLNREFPFKLGPVDKIELGLSSGLVRNFYEFDASQGGSPNKTIAVQESAHVSLKLFEALTAASSFSWEKVLLANGSWKDPYYAADFGLSLELSKKLALSLNQTTEDRALSYDYQTTKIALYDEQITIYKAAASYTF